MNTYSCALQKNITDKLDIFVCDDVIRVITEFKGSKYNEKVFINYNKAKLIAKNNGHTQAGLKISKLSIIVPIKYAVVDLGDICKPIKISSCMCNNIPSTITLVWGFSIKYNIYILVHHNCCEITKITYNNKLFIL